MTTAPLNKSSSIQLSRSIPIPHSESIRSKVFTQLIEWWREKYIPSDELQFHWTDLHISIVEDYLSSLSTTCVFPELPSSELLLCDCLCNANVVASFTQELGELFVVPRLNEFNETQNQRIRENNIREFAPWVSMEKPKELYRSQNQKELYRSQNQRIQIQKHHLVEGFISFLLRLLYHKTDSLVNSCKDEIVNLEKELRYLLFALGHISLMMLGSEHDNELQKLSAEFEAVTNEAGGVVHSLTFSTDRACGGIGGVVKHIGLLRGKILNFTQTDRSAYKIPETSVADSLVIINSLIHDLEDIMEVEDNWISVKNYTGSLYQRRVNNWIYDRKKHIRTLHQRLTSLQSSFKDVGLLQPSQFGRLKNPLMRIGDLAYEAEYLIISFLVGDAPLWHFDETLPYISHLIEFIGAKLQQDITKNYKFGGSKVDQFFSLQLPLLNEATVGWEDNVTPVLQHLVGGTQHLQVISIIGMPGLGKTTLAKILYYHPLINDSRFDKRSWSVVSQNYQRQSMLTAILTNINSEPEKYRILNMEEETLVELIHKILKGRRFLIIMDDVWDLKVWGDVQRCFPDDGNGSRILLTTRNKDATPPGSIIYQLPFLSNDQCWELLEKKVFGGRPCPPKLQEIGERIAANCYGLPLAVVVIAGILSPIHKEERAWEEVGGNVDSYIFDGTPNSVMQILELSYEHLPGHLKPCFLYLAAFEEDKEILVGNLMRLWNAEGFIHREKEKSAESIGEEYLKELIDKNLVMVGKRRSNGRVKTCVLHDLLRDMCLKRSKEENFLKILRSEYQTMLGKGNRIRALGDFMTLSNCQHVRSFYGSNQTSSLYVRDMRLLRVLRFDHIHHNHFIGIEYLYNLRYLVITNLPASIASLVNLEYLCVETSMTIILPPTIGNMAKLRYLHVLFPEYGKGWNISHTNNLQFLSWVNIRELKDEEILKCSPHLRKLSCRYELQSTSKGPHPSFNLHFLTLLETLNLAFKGSFFDKDFTFPSNIRKLTLSYSRMRWKNMSTIGRLENLEVLKLRDHAFEGERWDTRDGEFQKLRFLQLEKMPLVQ